MNKERKNNLVQKFIVGIFVLLYAFVSLISTIHVIDFFALSNPDWLAVALAIAFEFGAAASLAAIVVGEKTNKTLVWMLFFILTAFQMQGNMWYAYVNVHDFQSWAEMFYMNDMDIIDQKRIIAAVSGAVLPVVALGFIKSLVDYIKPEEKLEEKLPPDERDIIFYGATGGTGLGETKIENKEVIKDKYSESKIKDPEVKEDIKVFDEPLNKEVKEDIKVFDENLKKKETSKSIDNSIQQKRRPTAQ